MDQAESVPELVRAQVAELGQGLPLDQLAHVGQSTPRLGAAASRASAGALETVPIHEVPNLARFLAHGKRRGFWVAGTLPEGGSALTGFTHDQPLILVLGNEGRGMRPLVRRHCDFLLTIPLSGGGSLNVAAATAIVLFQLTQLR